MRAGAGYVTAFVPASLELVFELRLLEVMTRAAARRGRRADGRRRRGASLEAAQRAGALVARPGLGRATARSQFARELAARAPVPLLLDADGLNAHAGRARRPRAARRADGPDAARGRARPAARTSSDEIEARRLQQRARGRAARAARSSCSRATTRSSPRPTARAAISGRGAPALATAGTGDVLSGVIGALLAKGLDPFTAACAGVRRHAARRPRRRRAHGPDGVIASDVIAALPRALDGEPLGDGVTGEPDVDGRAGALTVAHAVRARVARVNLAAIERNGARLRRELAPGGALCAVVKADGYGHGAAAAARAALAGGAAWLAVARRQEAAALRAAASRRPSWSWARCRRELGVALAAGADVVAWDERFVAAVAARGGGARARQARHAAWAGSARATRRRRRASPRRRERRGGRSSAR